MTELLKALQVTEPIVHAWLIEHYSDERKMAAPRMTALKLLEGSFPYLRPPDVALVYRGLRNVAPGAVGRLVGVSNATRDKSWTTSVDAARAFATGRWTLDEPVEGALAVVMVAEADPAKLLLDWRAIAAIPEVAYHRHALWGEDLLEAILNEREVLAIAPLRVVAVQAMPMVPG